MLPQTITALTAKQFTRGDARVDRTSIADEIIVYLADPIRVVINGINGEIQDKAPIVAEIREALVGTTGDDDADRELQQIFSALLGTEGLVQHSLEDGMVLCNAKVLRTDDEGREVSRNARFLSSNPDVVLDHCYMHAVDSMERDAEKTHRVFDLCVARIPALEQRRQNLIGNAKQRVALRLDRGQTAPTTTP